MIGATLANGGVNPVTGVRAIAEEYVDNVLAVMATCGMYDFSGEWLYQTGLPAKSGVGGGILAVEPGRLGIGVFSPRLDAQGNSVRGIAACRELASDLGLHCSVLRNARCRRCASRRRAAAWRRSGAARRSRPSTCARGQPPSPLSPARRARVRLRSSRSCANSWPAPPTPSISSSTSRMVQGIDRAAARLLAACRRNCSARGKTLVVTRSERVVAAADRRGIRPRGVLCRRRLRARARRESAARTAFPGPGVGSARCRSRIARCSRASPATSCAAGPPARAPRVSRGANDHRGRPGLRRAFRHHATARRWSACRRRMASPVSTPSRPA